VVLPALLAEEYGKSEDTMRFKISKAELSEALSLINSVVPDRHPRQILLNFLLRGNADNTITLMATDTEISLKLTLPVSSMEEPDEILLSAREFIPQINSFDSHEEVEISVLKGVTEVKALQTRLQLTGQATEDFPNIADFSSEGVVFMPGSAFSDAVKKTIIAVAKGDTRYSLNGIYLTIQDSQAHFVASDTHRLALVEKEVKNPENISSAGIMLSKGMSILARLVELRGDIQIKLNNKELLAKASNAILIVHQVEGVFPRYKDLIPTNLNSRITLNREETIQKLQQAGLAAPEITKGVVFHIKPDTLDLTASSYGKEANVHLDAKVEGDTVDIKFNYSYLIDALKNIETSEIVLQYKDAENPAKIESGDYRYVLMPLDIK
jgi:DNA polymerase-3 subunit beta